MSLSSARATLADTRGKVDFVDGALAKYSSIEQTLSIVPSGSVGPVLETMLGSYQDAGQSSLSTISSVASLTGNTKNNLQSKSQGLLEGTLPLDQVLVQFEGIKGDLGGVATTSFGPVLEGVQSFGGELG